MMYISLDCFTHCLVANPQEARLLTWEWGTTSGPESTVFLCTILTPTPFAPNLVGLELWVIRVSQPEPSLPLLLGPLGLVLDISALPAPLLFPAFTNKILGTMLSVKIGRKGLACFGLQKYWTDVSFFLASSPGKEERVFEILFGQVKIVQS